MKKTNSNPNVDMKMLEVNKKSNSRNIIEKQINKAQTSSTSLLD